MYNTLSQSQRNKHASVQRSQLESKEVVDLLKSNEQRQLQSEKEQQQRYINYS